MWAKLPSFGLEIDTFDSVELVGSSRSASAREGEGTTRAEQRSSSVGTVTRNRPISADENEGEDLPNIAEGAGAKGRTIRGPAQNKRAGAGLRVRNSCCFVSERENLW